MATDEIANFHSGEMVKNSEEICDGVCYSPGEPPILTRVVDESSIETELDGDHSSKSSDRPPALSPQPTVLCDGPDFVSANRKSNFGDVFSPISEPVPQIDLMSEPALIESPSVSTSAATMSTSVMSPNIIDSSTTAPTRITPLIEPSKENIQKTSSDSMMVNLGGDANDSDQELGVRFIKEQNTFEETSSTASNAPNLLSYNATPPKLSVNPVTPSSKLKNKEIHSFCERELHPCGAVKVAGIHVDVDNNRDPKLVLPSAGCD
uniref:Uncharacterized protein n=1 Tax=Romanomermis culicivorax TaxID=13658 RepID=A0A915JDA5_ROMCU